MVSTIAAARLTSTLHNRNRGESDSNCRVMVSTIAAARLTSTLHNRNRGESDTHSVATKGGDTFWLLQLGYKNENRHQIRKIFAEFNRNEILNQICEILSQKIALRRIRNRSNPIK